MRFLFHYLKYKLKLIGAYALFSGIFALTFLLYELPTEAVLYPAAICAVIGTIMLVIDFCRVLRTHKVLCCINGIANATKENLAEPSSIECEDYRRIILLLNREQSERSMLFNKRYDDMVDYYTTWAHQIKTPIASMRLTLQKEDTALSRSLERDLFRIEQYVEMVLVFLRLDEGGSDYVIREYDLDAIVCQSIKKFAGEFIARKLRIEYEPLNIRVLTDEKWLCFVIEQLISNALKYTPSGSIRIYMSREKTLCIRDTGIGIAAEDLPRIFEKGYTGYHGREDKKASGIGLYLCKRICNNLSHRIWAQSEPDAGTSVYIDLSREELEVE